MSNGVLSLHNPDKIIGVIYLEVPVNGTRISYTHDRETFGLLHNKFTFDHSLII